MNPIMYEPKPSEAVLPAAISRAIGVHTRRQGSRRARTHNTHVGAKACTPTRINARARARMHARTHAHTHARMHACHARTRTHTHAKNARTTCARCTRDLQGLVAENRRQSVKMPIIDPKTGKSVGGSQEDVNVRTRMLAHTLEC